MKPSKATWPQYPIIVILSCVAIAAHAQTYDSTLDKDSLAALPLVKQVEEVIRFRTLKIDPGERPRHYLDKAKEFEESGNEILPILIRMLDDVETTDQASVIVSQMSASNIDDREQRSRIFRQILSGDRPIPNEGFKVTERIARATRLFGDASDAEYLLPLMDHESLSVRVLSVESLGLIGDASTAKEIERRLEARASPLTEEQKALDKVFKFGAIALEEIRKRSADSAVSVIIPKTSKRDRYQSIGSVRIGNLELLIVFQTPVTDEISKLIFDDLSLIYAHLESAQILRANNPKDAISSDGSTTFQLDHLLNIIGSGRYFPHEIEKSEKYIVTENDQNRLFISDELIRAYEKANNLRQVNLSKFRKLDDFLDNMNNLRDGSDPGLEDIFYYHSEANEHKSELMNEEITLQAFSDAYGRFLYRDPSILEVKEGSEFPDKYLKIIGELLVAKVFAFDEFGTLNEGCPDLVYHNDRWKLLMITPGI